MLRREEELRLHELTQQRMLAQGENSYVPIVEALQAQVSIEFGLAPAVGTLLLRCAESFARSESERAEIVQISLYRRHNRYRDGPLQAGDPAPCPARPLHPYPQQHQLLLPAVDLFAFLRGGGEGLPWILFAGSWS